MTLKDLVETRDIDSLTPSPDGRSIAFRVLIPSLAANMTTAQWYRVPVSAGSAPVPIGPISEPIYAPEFDEVDRGKALWSADSVSTFLLLQRNNRRQVYRAGPGPGFKQTTHDPADIEDFDLAPDQGSLTIKVRNPIADIQRARQLENDTGVHFDRTVFSEGLRLTDNFYIGTRPTTVRRQGPPTWDRGIQFDQGELRSKSVPLRTGLHAGPGPIATSANGILDLNESGALGRSLVWSSRGGSVSVIPDKVTPHGVIVQFNSPDGKTISCNAEFCRAPTSIVQDVSVLGDAGEIIISSEPNSSGRMGIYGWTPSSNKIRVIVPPMGALTGGYSAIGYTACPMIGHDRICIQEKATLPPRLVRIDLTDGTITVLAEPNLALAHRKHQPARLIDWTDEAGRKSYGVLVLPEDTSHPLPLVITTYTCHGYLRGGTGMPAPEQMLVQRGVAALCVSFDDDLDVPEKDAQGRDVPASTVKGAVAAIAAIIERLSADKIIDPRRVGIAGQSLSSNIGSYAVSHTDLFAAAMITGSTFDPFSHLVTAPAINNWREGPYTAQGLPSPDNDPRKIYADVSPALNASRIKAAVLLQPPENEWLFALQLFSAIQHAGGVTDMYVYPHAGHDPNRLPSHHYWRDLRSLDWFEYWLSGKPSLNLMDYRAWEASRISNAAYPLPSAAISSEVQ